MSVAGLAKRWNEERGFGFITPQGAASGQDIFCHRTAIIDGDCLVEGSTVYFDKEFEQAKGKFRAVNVRGGQSKGQAKGHGSPQPAAYNGASAAQYPTAPQMAQMAVPFAMAPAAYGAAYGSGPFPAPAAYTQGPAPMYPYGAGMYTQGPAQGQAPAPMYGFAPMAPMAPVAPVVPQVAPNYGTVGYGQ